MTAQTLLRRRWRRACRRRRGPGRRRRPCRRRSACGRGPAGAGDRPGCATRRRRRCRGRRRTARCRRAGCRRLGGSPSPASRRESSSSSTNAMSRSLDGCRLVAFHRGGFGSRGEDHGQVELEDRHPLGDPVGVEHAGATSPTAPIASRPATSVAERVGWSPAGTRCWSIRAPTSERRGELAPHGDRRRRLGAGEDDAEHLPLVGELARSRRVDVTDLEQRDARVAVRLVEGHGAQQPGAQRRAQHVLVGDERVGDPQHVAVEAGAGAGRRRTGTAMASPRRCRARGAPRGPGGGAAGPALRWPCSGDSGTRLGTFS